MGRQKTEYGWRMGAHNGWGWGGNGGWREYKRSRPGLISDLRSFCTPAPAQQHNSCGAADKRGRSRAAISHASACVASYLACKHLAREIKEDEKKRRCPVRQEEREKGAGVLREADNDLSNVRSSRARRLRSVLIPLCPFICPNRPP